MGDETAEIAVSLAIFDETDCAIIGEEICKLRTHNRCNALTIACFQKRPKAIEVIGIRERQAFVTPLPGRPADLFRRPCAPHEGII